jgi:hypothetical protein
MTVGRIPVIEGGIQPTIFDAKADLLTATANDTTARLAVGTNGQVLTADSTTGTGLKWAAPAASGADWSLLNAGGTALTGASTITVSGISGKDKVMIIIKGAVGSASRDYVMVRINGDTSAVYDHYGSSLTQNPTYQTSALSTQAVTNNAVVISQLSDVVGSAASGYFQVTGCNTSGKKMFLAGGSATPNGGDEQYQIIAGGVWNNTATVTSVSCVNFPSNFNGGSMWVYTSA